MAAASERPEEHGRATWGATPARASQHGGNTSNLETADSRARPFAIDQRGPICLLTWAFTGSSSLRAWYQLALVAVQRCGIKRGMWRPVDLYVSRPLWLAVHRDIISVSHLRRVGAARDGESTGPCTVCGRSGSAPRSPEGAGEVSFVRQFRARRATRGMGRPQDR
jgi:hypothetical protein